jgi:hypothetical protein
MVNHRLQGIAPMSAAIRRIVYAIGRRHTNANAGLWADRHATAAPHKIQFNGAGGSRPYIGFMRVGDQLGVRSLRHDWNGRAAIG